LANFLERGTAIILAMIFTQYRNQHYIQVLEVRSSGVRYRPPPQLFRIPGTS
jgi:hypothetical protein